MFQNRHKGKVNLTPLLFFGTFFQSQISWELYAQWSSNQAKNVYKVFWKS